MNKKIKYIILSLEMMIILVALHFPPLHPYHIWLEKQTILGFALPVPLVESIARNLSSFFLFVIPLILILYFSDKYIAQENSKKVFAKLAGVGLLGSMVGYFLNLSLSFVGFRMCSGDSCMLLLILFIFTAPLFVFLSLIFAGMVFNINSQNNPSAKEIVDRLLNKILKIVFVISMILLGISIYYSYKCPFCLSESNEKEEKTFFIEKFPAQLFGLERTEAYASIGNNIGITELLTGNRYGYNYYRISYGNGYADKFKLDRYEVEVALYAKNEYVNKVMSIIKKDFKEKNSNSNFIHTYDFSEIKNINGNKIFCTYNEYNDSYTKGIFIADECFWYNEENKYIIRFKGEGPYDKRNSERGKKYEENLINFLRYTSDLFPASENVIYE